MDFYNNLICGHVEDDYHAMTDRACKSGRIAFLFPHSKDPYWAGCDYGVISEAKRLGVAVDIHPCNT